MLGSSVPGFLSFKALRKIWRLVVRIDVSPEENRIVDPGAFWNESVLAAREIEPCHSSAPLAPRRPAWITPS
jgi:hypothetical protein